MAHTKRTKAQLLEELETLRARVMEEERARANLEEIIKEFCSDPPAAHGPPQREVIENERQSLQDLQTAHEELQVAEEELRQQNKELAITRLAAKREHDRYQDLFEFAPDGYLVTDAGGVVREANLTAEAMLNVPRETLSGKPLIPFIAPDQRKEFMLRLSALKESGKSQKWELHIYPRKRNPFYAEISLARELGPSNDASIRWLIHDITERKQAEETLRNGLCRFEILANAGEKFLRSAAPQKMVEEVCREVMEHLDCQAFFNFLVDEGAGKLHLNAYAGIPPEEAQRIEWLKYDDACCGYAARDGVRIVAEHIPTTPDERTEIMKFYGMKACACHPLLGPGEKTIGTLSFGTRTRETFSEDDLSLMKAVADMVAVAMIRIRNEEALYRANEWLKIAQRAAEAGVWDWDIRTGKLEWSAKMFDLFGLDPRETGASFEAWESILHPEDREKARSQIDEALKQHVFLDSESRIVRPNGQTRWINALGQSVYDEQGNPIRMSGICIDITGRKQAEEALARRAQVDAALAEMSGALMKSATLEEISAVALKHTGLLTQSPYGFAGYGIPGTKHFVSASLTRNVWDLCQAPGKSVLFENLSSKHGIPGWVWEHRKPLLANNASKDPRYKGVPLGHVPITRLLVVPAMVGEKPLGLIALANSESDYTEDDLKVVTRFANLYALAIQRRQAEEQIERQSAILDAINTVFQETLRSKTEEDAGRACLERAEMITGSKFGFISEINEEGTSDTIALSDPGWAECRMQGVDKTKMIAGMKIRGLCGRVITEGCPLIVNDPANHPDRVGVPEGHPPITAFLGVPLKQGEKTTGMIALANRPGGYTLANQQDVEALSIAFVEALNRKRAQVALRESETRFRNLSRNLEETVRHKTAELLQVEHLAAIGQMVSTVAHEVRNPIQTIQLGLDALRGAPRDERERQEVLEEIEYGARMLEGTISELLQYVRPVKLEFSLVPVKDVVEGALRLLADKIKNITTHVELERGDEELCVDAVRFTQVLVNTILNAADAMPDGGSLRIRSRSLEHGNRRFLEISIMDTGSGIEETYMDDICKPFFTTKTRGTGLGLSLCRKILDAHNGTMIIRSKLGEGTTVELKLPMENRD